MRTDKKKVNLANVSQQYKEAQQAQRQQAAEQPNIEKPRRAMPLIGSIVGLGGIGGTTVGYFTDVPIAVIMLISICGCIGAVICKGPGTEEDGLAHKICATMAALSIVAGIVVLTIYLKGTGLWNFTDSIGK